MAALFTTVLLVIAQVSENRPTPQSLPTLSVCDVVASDPTKLNGKIIKVRGVLIGTQEGLWLGGECKSQLVTKGVTWSNLLSIYVDGSDESIMRSWGSITVKRRQLHAVAADKTWLTIIGRLETRLSMDQEVQETPHGWVKLGFGHLNESPAEINFISVEDVSIERSERRSSK